MFRQSQLFKFTDQSSSSSGYLVSFKAGRSALSGTTVTSDPSKRGLIYLTIHPDSSLRFCWKNRKSNEVEEEIVLLPDDAEFVELPECKTGRAFVLRFRKSPRRLFFWSQEAVIDGQKAEDYAGKINDIIKNPRVPNASASQEKLTTMLTGSGPGNSKSQVLLRLLSELYPKEFGNLKKSTQKSTSGTSLKINRQATGSKISIQKVSKRSNRKSKTKLPLLRSKINAQPEQKIDLSTALNMEVLRPLLNNERFMTGVRDKLPKTESVTKEEAKNEFQNTVRSAQFQQSLQAFSSAFQAGRLTHLIAQFDLGPGCMEASMTGSEYSFVIVVIVVVSNLSFPDLEAFCRCLTENQRNIKTSASKSNTGLAIPYRRMSPSKGSKNQQNQKFQKTMKSQIWGKSRKEDAKGSKISLTKKDKQQPKGP